LKEAIDKVVGKHGLDPEDRMSKGKSLLKHKASGKVKDKRLLIPLENERC
jgi:hypothetical protein